MSPATVYGHWHEVFEFAGESQVGHVNDNESKINKRNCTGWGRVGPINSDYKTNSARAAAKSAFRIINIFRGE